MFLSFQVKRTQRTNFIATEFIDDCTESNHQPAGFKVHRRLFAKPAWNLYADRDRCGRRRLLRSETRGHRQALFEAAVKTLVALPSASQQERKAQDIGN